MSAPISKSDYEKLKEKRNILEFQLKEYKKETQRNVYPYETFEPKDRHVNICKPKSSASSSLEIEELETLLLTLDEEKYNLEAEIERFQDKMKSTVNKEEDNLIDTFVETKDVPHKVINIPNDESKEHILQGKTLELEKDLQHFTELYESKRNELKLAKDLLKQLNNEIFCHQSELELERHKALNIKSRGNSMFFKLEEMRTQIDDQLKVMQKNHGQMELQLKTQQHEIDKLQEINSVLLKNLQDLINSNANFDQYLAPYKQEMDGLYHNITNIIKEITDSSAIENVDQQYNFKYATYILQKKKQEITPIRREYLKVAEALVSDSTLIRNNRNEIRTVKLKLHEDENHIESYKLKGKLDNDKIVKSNQTTQTELFD